MSVTLTHDELAALHVCATASLPALKQELVAYQARGLSVEGLAVIGSYVANLEAAVRKLMAAVVDQGEQPPAGAVYWLDGGEALHRQLDCQALAGERRRAEDMPLRYYDPDRPVGRRAFPPGTLPPCQVCNT